MPALVAMLTSLAQAQPEVQRALVRQYCAGCHNEQRKTAGLILSSADLSQVANHAPMWEKVIRKVRAGAMPPLGMPRPDRAALDAFATFLESAIDSAAKSYPGPSTVRRLNRAEYGAAIRDLLDLNIDVTALLPADDANYGFDNNADSLRISPGLLEGYLAASRKVSRLAIGDPAIQPVFSTYRVRPDLGQDSHVDGLPLGTRGGMLAEHTFPLDGVYLFKPRVAVNTSAKVRGLDYEHRFLITIDGRKVHEARLGGPADVDAAALNPPESEAEILKRLEARVPVSAGPHKIGVTFIRKTGALPDGYLQPWLRTNFDTQEQRGVPLVESLSIGGPFEPAGAGDTPSRRRIFICRPAGADDAACAKRILETLASRAYRRPLTQRDLEPLLNLYQGGKTEGGFEAGVENALRFLLTSPAFLFRAETDPAGAAPGSIHRVSDIDLASRLSFFLWSSLPDDELRHLAGMGELKDAAVLEAQARRMLADPRSRALTTNFAAQWLYLRNLSGVTRDLMVFPDFDDNLRQGFRTETELFFDSIIREDRSVLDLLTADYTFVNERLAKHYAIPDVEGSYFRRVAIPGEQRRGLLGQGSILTVTSYATRTSPVLRGKWLLENVLGTPVPPPPPDVPALAENRTGVKPRSVRERLEEHRSNPACAVCHNLMDPIGFSLENFDATGAWRDRGESKSPIDASGVLVDGTKVNGPQALRQALLSRPETFVTTLTEKLMTYALGRGIDYYDMPAVRGVVRRAAQDNFRFSSIVLGIVESVPFQMSRTSIEGASP
ncbi:MAG: hypothetical protein C5B51_01565 [Terriglobia bacterium]|nr:MAG: hypothetical protein C5B51_01565 [Terriglobia bacterium]